MKYNQNLFLIVFFALSFFLFGWFSHSSYTPVHKIEKKTCLTKIKEDNELKVVMLNAPTTYYIGVNGAKGFEYDLLKNYADKLGVDLNVTAVNTVAEAVEIAKTSDIHIVSAALTKTAARVKEFNFGPSYFEVQQQVVCSRKLLQERKFPRDVESLAGLHIKVGEDTSYSDTIRALIKDGFDINVTYTSAYATEELLQQVSKNTIDCTLADSNIYALNLRYYPEMEMAFTISEREQ
ncbi:transporter substrate-binding domain-containing protein, partial [Sulfurimonas sp.]|nr:transporter substrate-binding domain-containing protein [Sulfurimonas sp.]